MVAFCANKCDGRNERSSSAYQIDEDYFIFLVLCFIWFFKKAIYHRLGDTLARLHQWTEAERFHQAALEVQPDHVATHVSYGTMLARNVSCFFATFKPGGRGLYYLALNALY